MLDLRHYQIETDRRVRLLESTYGNPSICIHYATGGGKGVQLVFFLLDGSRQLVITHRRVLLDQISDVLTRHGIEHGFIAAGKPLNLQAPIQLAMIQTLWSRSFKRSSIPHFKDCRRIHIDEIHQMAGHGGIKIIEKYRGDGATVIGYTATPNKLSHIIDHVVNPISVKELIQQGFLCPYTIFQPDMPDMERLAKVKRDIHGEFASNGLGNVLNMKAIFGRARQHWRLLNPEEKPTILFAPGVPHSLHLIKEFCSDGIPSAHIDGKDIYVDGNTYPSSSELRVEIFQRFKEGDLKVLGNRFVLREGVDLTCIGHIINATTFGTRISWQQACGRGLRPHSGKDRLTIQDHGGNRFLHPDLDSDEEWDIKISAKEAAKLRLDKQRDADPKDPEPIVCPKCSCLRVAGDTCNECGHKHIKSSRVVVQVNGRLKIQDNRVFKPRKDKHAATDAEIWKRHFWAWRRNIPNRTFKCLYGYLCRIHFRRFSKTLPFMPIDIATWHDKISETPFNLLFGEFYMPKQEYDNTNTGVLFTNDRKEQENQPDVNGTLDVNGVEYYIAGWSKQSKDGMAFISLRINPKDAKAKAAKATKPAAAKATSIPGFGG